MLFPQLEVTIQANRVSVRNMDSGTTGSADAPFSCSHQLISDVDIFEHACSKLLKHASGSPWWSFPRLAVVVPGRELHSIERKVIEDLLKNAGAQQVTFVESNRACEEQLPSQLAYVGSAKRKP